MCEEELQKEELTVFAHLGSRETDEVAVYLAHKGLWGSGMIYDCDTSLLMTKTAQAKEVVMGVLEQLNLLPAGATILQSAIV